MCAIGIGMANFAIANPVLVTVGSLAVAGIGFGFASDSAGHWLEGLVPGWGPGRGLGRALRHGDVGGIAFNGFFLAIDLLTMGGIRWVMGSQSAVVNVGKETIKELYESLVKVAQNPDFVKRALSLGYTPQNIDDLLLRLQDYFITDKIKVGERLVALTDENVLKIGQWQLGSIKVMSHELTHLLDDISYGLFQKSQGMHWLKTVWGTEFRAAYMHAMWSPLGRPPIAGLAYGIVGAVGTPFMNLFEMPLYNIIRQTIYYSAQQSQMAPPAQQWEN
jgi:hypothetical protein